VLIDRIDGGDMMSVDGLLVQFATMTARRDDDLPRLPRLFAGISTGPIVLIVGRFDPSDAAAVGPVAHHSTLPVLLAAAPVAGALDLAADHGWHVAAIDAERDLAPAWANAIGRGAHHVVG